MIENGIPDCSISSLGYILEKEHGLSLEKKYYFGHKFFCKEEFGVLHISGTPFGNEKLSGRFLEDSTVRAILDATNASLVEEFIDSVDSFIDWVRSQLLQKKRCFLPFVHSSISSRNDPRDIYHTLVIESYDSDKALYFCTDQTGDCWVTAEDLSIGLSYILKEFRTIRKLEISKADNHNPEHCCNHHRSESLTRTSKSKFVNSIVLFTNFLSNVEQCEKIYSPRIWTFKQQRKSESIFLRENESSLYCFLDNVLKELEKAWTLLDMKILKHNTTSNSRTRASVINTLHEIRRLEERYFSICENYYINS